MNSRAMSESPTSVLTIMSISPPAPSRSRTPPSSRSPSRVVAVDFSGEFRGFASSDASVRSFMVSSHSRNEGVLFKNGSNEFKIMVRPSFDESDDPAEDVQFQVCIISDPSDGSDVSEAIEMEFEGVYDDEDDSVVVVHEVFVKKMSELVEGADEASKLRKAINEVYEWRVCPCGKRFAKRVDDRSCLLCELTASDSERAALADETRSCAVCLDPCGERHSKRMKCCGAFSHDRCRKRWLVGHQNCPHCRANIEDRVEQIVDLL